MKIDLEILVKACNIFPRNCKEWVRFDHLTGVPDWTAPRVGRELYAEAPTGDLTYAFAHDHTNVAEDPAHADVVSQLSRMLRTIV